MLEFDEASKRFGAVATLDGCAFSARPGRLTGFLGPNGAGKTTAMRAVFGLVEFDAGAVRWWGAPIGASERARFENTPEERGLYPRMQVRDQLVYLGELCGRKRRVVSQNVDRWMERLGRADRAGDRLDALSHGNQQRVQLIGALVDEPELLVLDEPFSGLDPLAMGAMAGLFAELTSAGATVLFSSHQLDLVEDLCEDVVIINKGRNVMEGNVASLKEDSPHRRLEIDVVNGDGAWLPEMAGIESREVEGSLVRLLVTKDFDLEAVLSVARAVGPIRHFSFEAPSLSEMFLRAVTS